MAKQTFTTGQVLTAAQMTDLQQTAMTGGAASTKTVSYVLVAADAGTRVAMNAAGATTITVNTGLFSAGDTVSIQNIGAGVCTVTAGTATVNTSGSLVLAQYQGGILYFTSASTAIFFQFATPASGDIEGVTAGTGISGGGTSGTVTITNSMATEITAKGDLIVGTGNAAFDNLPAGTNGHLLTADSSVSPTGLKWAVDPVADVVTTAGDLIYGTAADTVTRLGIGTAGQVLKVNSGATAPEWGAAGAASGLTLISRSSFSNVAGQNFDDVFSSTYNAYKIIIENIYAGTDSDTLRLQVRTSGTTQTSGYYGSVAKVNTSATTFGSSANTSNGASLQLNNGNIGNNTSGASYGCSFDWVRVGSTNYNKLFGVGFNTENSDTLWFAGFRFASENVTGFRLFASTSNVTGTVAVYGYGA